MTDDLLHLVYEVTHCLNVKYYFGALGCVSQWSRSTTDLTSTCRCHSWGTLKSRHLSSQTRWHSSVVTFALHIMDMLVSSDVIISVNMLSVSNMLHGCFTALQLLNGSYCKTSSQIVNILRTLVLLCWTFCLECSSWHQKKQYSFSV